MGNPIGDLDLLSSDAKVAMQDFMQSIVESARPVWGIRSRRVGGATLQVPCQVPERKSVRMGLCWIVNAARAKGRGMVDALKKELVDVYNKAPGSAVLKKRSELLKMAESNRANSSTIVYEG